MLESWDCCPTLSRLLRRRPRGKSGREKVLSFLLQTGREICRFFHWWGPAPDRKSPISLLTGKDRRRWPVLDKRSERPCYGRADRIREPREFRDPARIR